MKTKQQVRDCLAIVEANQVVKDENVHDALNKFGLGMDMEAAEESAAGNQTKIDTLKWVLAEV